MGANVNVGFIGLGTMGARMAASLQRAGYQLIVNDIRRAAAEPHLQKGAEWADTPRQVAEAAEVVFTSLPAPPDVEAVASGENGIISGMRRGGVYFDLVDQFTGAGAAHLRELCRPWRLYAGRARQWGAARRRERPAGYLGRR